MTMITRMKRIRLWMLRREEKKIGRRGTICWFPTMDVHLLLIDEMEIAKHASLLIVETHVHTYTHTHTHTHTPHRTKNTSQFQKDIVKIGSTLIWDYDCHPKRLHHRHFTFLLKKYDLPSVWWNWLTYNLISKLRGLQITIVLIFYWKFVWNIPIYNTNWNSWQAAVCRPLP